MTVFAGRLNLEIQFRRSFHQNDITAWLWKMCVVGAIVVGASVLEQEGPLDQEWKQCAQTLMMFRPSCASDHAPLSIMSAISSFEHENSKWLPLELEALSQESSPVAVTANESRSIKSLGSCSRSVKDSRSATEVTGSGSSASNGSSLMVGVASSQGAQVSKEGWDCEAAMGAPGELADATDEVSS